MSAADPGTPDVRADAVPETSAPETVASWRRRVDASARLPVLAYVLSGVVWLLAGAVFDPTQSKRVFAQSLGDELDAVVEAPARGSSAR